MMKPIHDWMPVIILPDLYNLWLGRNMHDPLELQKMYKHYPPELMVANIVPDLVNNPRFDNAACIVQM